MLRLTIANQRGGAGKTTTAVNYAWFLAQNTFRTLLIDTDSQGSIQTLLDVHSPHHFADFLLQRRTLNECVVSISANLDVLCGSKQTVEVEGMLLRSASPLRCIEDVLAPYTSTYEAVIIDLSPSMNLVQASALVYARKVLIPVNMDVLSLSGGRAVYDALCYLNQALATDIRIIGLLPCQIDQRLFITSVVQTGIEELSHLVNAVVFPGIRTDQSVNRASLAHLPVLAYDARSRAAQDFAAAFQLITSKLCE